MKTRPELPNENKISYRRRWRALCRWAAARRWEAQGVTSEPVSCIAWLGVLWWLLTGNVHKHPECTYPTLLHVDLSTAARAWGLPLRSTPLRDWPCPYRDNELPESEWDSFRRMAEGSIRWSRLMTEGMLTIDEWSANCSLPPRPVLKRLWERPKCALRRFRAGQPILRRKNVS